RVFAPGNRRAARAGAGRGVGRYGCHAHGHRRRHASRRAVRTHRRAVRLLALSRACRRAGARARLPPLLRDGHRGLPARPPSLPRRYHPRGGGRRGGAPRRVNRATTTAEERLIGLVADAVRGPKREGLFALWLVVRSAEALLPPRPVSGKNHRRRLPALDARLASPALPGPPKRALRSAPQHLDPSTPPAAALALSQLVAPAPEGLGPRAGGRVTGGAPA